MQNKGWTGDKVFECPALILHLAIKVGRNIMSAVYCKLLAPFAEVFAQFNSLIYRRQIALLAQFYSVAFGSIHCVPTASERCLGHVHHLRLWCIEIDTAHKCERDKTVLLRDFCHRLAEELASVAISVEQCGSRLRGVGQLSRLCCARVCVAGYCL